MYKSSYTSNRPYIPSGISEIWDFLGSMMLAAPTFKDKRGYFPERNIETEFFALNEGLKTIRKQVGEKNYQALVALSEKMKAHFEVAPQGNTEDTIKGRNCIMEMVSILEAGRRENSP